MADWAAWVARFGVPVEAGFDRLRHRLNRRTAQTRDMQVVTYRGFGNQEQIYIKGRVLRMTQPGPCTDRDGLWRNVLATYRRFNSSEVPNVAIEVSIGSERQRIETNGEGYFEAHLSNVESATGWVPIHIELPGGSQNDAHALVPANARFGVISDIDDTVVMSHVHDFLKMARAVFLQNARGRVAFPGVAAFYRALQAGTASGEFNPIFYVSSGPWNLYDLLADFFELNGIPRGPILLQDYGLEEDRVLAASHLDHKLAQINKILQTYPDLPFILIGDSGQHDPEIYTKVLEEAPNRIKAIYIRDVSEKARDEQVKRLAMEVARHGGELLLVRDSLEAARHAASRGFIQESEVPKIAEQKIEDLTVPDPPLDH